MTQTRTMLTLLQLSSAIRPFSFKPPTLPKPRPQATPDSLRRAGGVA